MSAGCSRGRIKLRFLGFANQFTISHFEKKASVFMTGSFFFDMDFCACFPIAYSALKKPPPPPAKRGSDGEKNQVVGVVKGFT